MRSPVKIWRRQKYLPRLLGKHGKIVSWTVIRTPPTGFKRLAPYIILLVEFTDGQRLTGQLVDYQFPQQNRSQDKVELIGRQVKAVLRKVVDASEEEVIPYGIKFKLIKENGGSSLGSRQNYSRR